MTVSKMKLTRKGDAIYATCDGGEPIEAKLIYARPISNREGQISIFDRKKKEEIGWLESIDELDPDSKAIAKAALATRYIISRIESVDDSFVNHGHRYLKVTTNRGFRYFNLKEPGKNVTWLSDDHLIIRDSMGNRYEVISLAELDSDSRENLDLVL